MIKKHKKHINELQTELLTNKNPSKSKQQNKQISNRSHLPQLSSQSLQLKQLKKSIVQYMQQKDNQLQKNKKLQLSIQKLKDQLKQLRIKYEKQLQEKVDKENQIKRKDNMRKINEESWNDQGNEGYEKVPLVIDNLYAEEQKMFDNRSPTRNLFNIDEKRQLFYQSSSSKKQQRNSHQNNKKQHNELPMDHIIQINESLHCQISNLTSKLQTQQIFHQNQLKNLQFTVQRYKKQLQQKQQDLVRVLVKLKPLLLEKHKLTSRQNNSHNDNIDEQVESQRLKDNNKIQEKVQNWNNKEKILLIIVMG